jgi:uncharacterized Zn finger protein (UPF0148 family)
MLRPRKNPGLSIGLLKLAESKGYDLPTELVGTYVLDYDLTYADRVVKQVLTKGIKDAESNLKKLPDIELAIAKAPNRVERLALERQRSEIQKAFTVKQQLELAYITSSSSLIDEYKKCPAPAPVIVGQEFALTEEDYQRIDVIERWLHLAQRYIPVRVIREMASSDRCSRCQEVYEIEDGEMFCPSCFTVVTSAEAAEAATSDSASQAAPKKKNYSLVINLSKTLDRIQGTSDVKIPYDEIEAAFNAHATKYGWQKDQIKKDQILDMLKLYGYADFYPDINYIMHMYIGTPLPDYSVYKEQVLEKYTAFLQVYDQIPKARTSALNAQYTIHKILQLLGCKTSPGDFKMTKGYETLCEYERIWKEACTRLGGADHGWPFVPSFVNDD